MEKNIFVLGDPGCGKRSFVLSYKDGISNLEFQLPEMPVILYKKRLTRGHVILRFILDRSSDALIPSVDQSIAKPDLVLILVDLSSEYAQDRLRFYSEFADQHFHGVKLILVGTKSDKQLYREPILDLLVTSAKTGDGFDDFNAQLEQAISANVGGNFCLVS